MTIGEMCEAIARDFERRGVTLRNLVTGRTIPDAAGVYRSEDIFNWSSHGELFHIWEWYKAITKDDDR